MAWFVVAEVRDMRVPAELHVQSRSRLPGEIRGHQIRRAAVERKRRHQHPAVADRHKVGDPVGRLLLEQLDRIGAVERGLPFGA